MANKIKFGLKNVYYAVATIDATGAATYETPVRIPGAVSLSMEPQGETTKFYADNIVYWTGVANNGYEGDLEIARIPESFETDVLGFVDDTNHVMVESADAPTVPFALLFQFEGDEKATRHVLYNCTASRPSVEGATKEETTEPQTETLSLVATTVYNTSLAQDIVKSKTSDTTTAATYNDWFTSVYQPTTTNTP